MSSFDDGGDTGSASVDFGAIASRALERMDTPDAAPEVPVVESAPAGDAPAATETPAPVAEVPAAETDVFDDSTVQSFDRDYVSKLRDKEARYRTERNELQERWGEWDKTLEGLDADQQGLARELVGSILTGDLKRAAEIIGPDELAKVLDVPVAAVEQAVDAATPEAPLTRADLDAALAERETARQQQAEIDAVYSQAKSLGYDPEAKPGSADFGRWVMVMQYAQQEGTLEAGHAALQAAEAAERQRIIDEFVESRNTGSPAPAGASGAAAREPEDAWLDKGLNPLEAAKRRAMGRFTEDRSQVG